MEILLGLGLKALFFPLCLQGAPLEEPLWAPNDMQVDDLPTIIKVGRSSANFGLSEFALSSK